MAAISIDPHTFPTTPTTTTSPIDASTNSSYSYSSYHQALFPLLQQYLELSSRLALDANISSPYSPYTSSTSYSSSSLLSSAFPDAVAVSAEPLRGGGGALLGHGSTPDEWGSPVSLLDDPDHVISSTGDFYRGPHFQPLEAGFGSQSVSKEFANKVSFVFGIILIPCFSVFGSVGNVLSLVVLVHQRMRNATNTLLAALAISDLLVLLLAAYFSFLRIYKIRNFEQSDHLRTQTFPLLGPYFSVFTARITTCLTTMLSLERLVAVYFPMTAKAKCGRTTTAVCIALIYVVTPLLFLPSAFKYHARHKPVGNHTVYDIELTSFGKNRAFFVVYGHALNVTFRLLPILVLVVTNFLIIVAIKKTWSLRRVLSHSAVPTPAASFEQTRITLMLVMVSTVFLGCILPGAVHIIYTKIDKQYSRFGAESNLHSVFSTVTYFLETVNSSVNFFIYMAFSKKFNHTYTQIFCCRCGGENTPRRNGRTIFRASLRGSRSRTSSYRELYILSRMRKNGNIKQDPQLTEAEIETGSGRGGIKGSMKKRVSPPVIGSIAEEPDGCVEIVTMNGKNHVVNGHSSIVDV